jgi:hypothetical protein
MHTIQTQVQITADHHLTIQLPEDLETGTYQVVIVMNLQPDPDDTPDNLVIEGIREGLKEAINGQTIPLSQMWEGIDVE